MPECASCPSATDGPDRTGNSHLGPVDALHASAVQQKLQPQIGQRADTTAHQGRDEEELTGRVREEGWVSTGVGVGVDAPRQPDRIALRVAPVRGVVVAAPVVEQPTLPIRDLAWKTQ